MNNWTQEQLADRLLCYLRERPTAVPLKTLQQKFRVDQPQLLAAIKELSSWGYKLKAMRGIVRFIRVPDILTPTEIHYKLKAKKIGVAAHCYRSIKSTNDLAAQMAEQGAPEGAIITAEQQTRGRGRFGRNWHSPSGLGIYVSIVLRPAFPPDKAPGLSLMTALALADTLSVYCPGEVRIKWPNDILLAGRKAAGILTELSAERNKINHVIVGVGINANQQPRDFPPELRRLAISLRHVTKKPVNRAELLREFLYQFERQYAKYCKTGLRSARKRLREYSVLIGQEVQIQSGQQVIRGMATDIDSDGALILMGADKQRIRIAAGEVSVVKH